MGFKMAPWGGVSSPFTGESRLTGSGSRRPCGSCRLTWYRARREGAGLPQKLQDSWREGVSCAHGYTDAQGAPPCALGAASGPGELRAHVGLQPGLLAPPQNSPGGSCLGSAPSAALCAPLDCPPPMSSVPQPASVLRHQMQIVLRQAGLSSNVTLGRQPLGA